MVIPRVVRDGNRRASDTGGLVAAEAAPASTTTPCKLQDQNPGARCASQLLAGGSDGGRVTGVFGEIEIGAGLMSIYPYDRPRSPAAEPSRYDSPMPAAEDFESITESAPLVRELRGRIGRGDDGAHALSP